MHWTVHEFQIALIHIESSIDQMFEMYQPKGITLDLFVCEEELLLIYMLGLEGYETNVD